MPRSWRGNAGRDWPQLQRVRLGDFEARTMTDGGVAFNDTQLQAISATLSQKENNNVG
jgi:hypothetical protein